MRYTLCLLILGTMALPHVHQYIKPFYEPEPLSGAIEEKVFPKFTWESWFDVKFQDSTHQYLNENFGFRSTLIRANNQVQFSLFNRIKANSVISGKEHYLFEENYIKATTGLDFIGFSAVDSIANDLEDAVAILRADSIEVVIVFAPGKGTYCAEFIPDYYLEHKKEHTNYKALSEELGERDLHVINFQDWFLRMKDTTSVPLYPKCGIHWSKWGEFLAADSLVSYIEELTGKSLPHFEMDSSYVSEENLDTDYDIGRGLNLLKPVETFPMRYPQWHISPRLQADSIRVLSIADSYYWGMFNIGVSRDLFGNGQFWFYNEQVFPDSYDKPLFTKDFDYYEALKKYDVVVLLFTDANLSRFPCGFSKKVLEARE